MMSRIELIRKIFELAGFDRPDALLVSMGTG
jgi:hypothetical protein